jgi:predicted metal-binding membrane protein
MNVAGMAMPDPGAWSVAELWAVFVMWAVMMAAMMAPSVAPVVLLYRRVVVARATGAAPLALTALFVLGYLAVWTAFSAVATLLQWALHSAALLSDGMRITANGVSGAVLVLAGIYQWTPLKHACLSRCRTPVTVLLHGWREGRVGALAMGLRHGAYCVGCCSLLMAILFVVGVMNVAWIAALTAIVLAEKLLPRGEVLARASGALLVAWGAWLVVWA